MKTVVIIATLRSCQRKADGNLMNWSNSSIRFRSRFHLLRLSVKTASWNRTVEHAHVQLTITLNQNLEVPGFFSDVWRMLIINDVVAIETDVSNAQMKDIQRRNFELDWRTSQLIPKPCKQREKGSKLQTISGWNWLVTSLIRTRLFPSI